MEPQRTIVSISTLSLLKIAAAVLVLWFLYVISDVLLLLLIAVVLATLLEPLADKLEAQHMPRAVAVAFLYLILFVFLVFFIQLLIPPISEQFTLLTNNFPDVWRQISETFNGQADAYQSTGGSIQQELRQFQAQLTTAARGVYGFIIAVFENVVNFILLLVVTFYLVVQRDALSKLLKAITLPKYHGYVDDLSNRIQQKITIWARGQLILGAIVAALSYIGLLILMPKYALILALIAGVTELIPYIGPIIGAVPAVLLGFSTSVGVGIGVLILYVIIQQLENSFIVPQVMGRQLGMNPILIIVAVLIGGRLMGVIGMILAIPIATALDVVVRDFAEKSDFKKIRQSVDT